MRRAPIYPTRRVRPGTLAVRQDWTRHEAEPRWAILSERPLHPCHKLAGRKRGAGESHAGLYVYQFRLQATALTVATHILNSGLPVWEAAE